MNLFWLRKACVNLKNGLRLSPEDPELKFFFTEYRNNDIADMSIYILCLGAIVCIQNGIPFFLKPTLVNFLLRLPLLVSLVMRIVVHICRLRFNNWIGWMMLVVYTTQTISLIALNYDHGTNEESSSEEV